MNFSEISFLTRCKAHEAIHQWLTANNKTAIGSPWEVYANDPILEKDTAKWQTDVYYRIE